MFSLARVAEEPKLLWLTAINKIVQPKVYLDTGKTFLLFIY